MFKEKEAMKIKLVVMDLELSKRAKRIAAAVLVPALVIAGGAIAYAGTLHVWNDGDMLNSSDLNGNFADHEARIAALESPANGTWQSYPVSLVDAINPTTKITTGVGSNNAFYRRRGDSIEVRIYTDFNAPPSPSGVRIGWTLPVGLSIDTTKLPGHQAGFPYRDTLGTGVWSYAGSGDLDGYVNTVPSTSVVAFSQGADDLRTDTVGIDSGVVELFFSVPVTP